MTIKVGDRFIGYNNGVLFECTAVSKYGSMVTFKQRGPNHYDWVLCGIPVYVIAVEKLLRDKEWIPDTPAGRTLYGPKVTER